MSGINSALHQAQGWFAQQDEMGGFAAAAAMLFPGWTPKPSCRAPHREDKRPSFSVYRNGQGEWRFKDHSGAGEQGGLVGFVMLAGMNKEAAVRWLIDKAGMPAKQPASFDPTPRHEHKAREPERLPAMPLEAMAAWREGVDYLAGQPELVERLAEFRGWPVEFAQYVVDCGVISMPLHRGERTIAFLVTVPEPGTTQRCRINMRDVGFHCRLKPRAGEEKASWRFVPSEKEHKQSTPALPFIISGSDFDSVRLLIITEGQWDALTFALAAGWLGDGCLWPEGVCVVGIRGASGTDTFLHHYRPLWPKGANCLLLPDADRAGGKWFEDGESFADRLARLCRRVAVIRCGEYKDFNDLYRARRVAPQDVAELLNAQGMTLESGVTA